MNAAQGPEFTKQAIGPNGRTIFFDDLVRDGELVEVEGRPMIVYYDPNAPDWFVDKDADTQGSAESSARTGQEGIAAVRGDADIPSVEPGEAAPSDPSAAQMPARDALLTQLQETGELFWPWGWPLSWLLDLVDTLGIDRDQVILRGHTIVVGR